MRRAITSVYTWELDCDKTLKEVGRGESKACSHFDYSLSFLVTLPLTSSQVEKKNYVFLFLSENKTG